MYFLRRADPADADALRTMTSDDEAAWGYSCPLLPSAEWWRNKIKRAEGYGLFIVAQRSNSNELVAFIEVGNDGSQPMRRHVGAVGLCVRRDHRRKGVGRALLTKAIEWSDQWLALTRLEITVWEAHVGAIRLYASLGFEHEGRHPAYGFGAGGLRCAVSMARLKPADSLAVAPAVLAEDAGKRDAIVPSGAATMAAPAAEGVAAASVPPATKAAGGTEGEVRAARPV